MIIKKSVGYILVLLLCFYYGTAQDTKKELDSLANRMFVDMNNRDYEAILAMTHPKVFDIVPKEQMKTIIKGIFEGNEEFSIDVPKVIPDYKLSEITKIEDKDILYAFLSYDMNMNMTFKNQEFEEEEKQMMTNMMQAKGMEVEFLSSNSLALLLKDQVTVFINDDSTANEWVMLNYDPDSPLSYQILPSSILEAAKTHRQNLMMDRKKKSENKN